MSFFPISLPKTEIEHHSYQQKSKKKKDSSWLEWNITPPWSRMSYVFPAVLALPEALTLLHQLQAVLPFEPELPRLLRQNPTPLCAQKLGYLLITVMLEGNKAFHSQRNNQPINVFPNTHYEAPQNLLCLCVPLKARLTCPAVLALNSRWATG